MRRRHRRTSIRFVQRSGHSAKDIVEKVAIQRTTRSSNLLLIAAKVRVRRKPSVWSNRCNVDYKRIITRIVLSYIIIERIISGSRNDNRVAIIQIAEGRFFCRRCSITTKGEVSYINVLRNQPANSRDDLCTRSSTAGSEHTPRDDFDIETLSLPPGNPSNTNVVIRRSTYGTGNVRAVTHCVAI